MDNQYEYARPKKIINNDLKEVLKSICKLKYSDGGKCVANGLLIKLNKNNNPFYCLLTNAAVIR